MFIIRGLRGSFLLDKGEFKSYIILIHHLVDLKDHVLRSITVEAGLDPVLVVVGGRGEVHVHQTVVDPVVLDVNKMVVRVEVLSSIVLKPLGVTKLVINAVLENQSDD